MSSLIEEHIYREPMALDPLEVPLNDLRIQPEEEDLVAEAIRRVMRHGRFILGAEVEAFESEFASFCGVRHAVGVANGTDALELALRAAGVGPGDSVITVANAGFYGTAAILTVGASPVFVDVNPRTLTMSFDSFAARVSESTKAVIITHLYGRLAETDAILALAQTRGLQVIEDCAQAHGASRGGKRAGSLGNLGCFSFYPTKNLGALGDGGAVVTSDESLASKLTALRQYGWRTSKYRVDDTDGRNSRLDELQAAVLRVRLARLESVNQRRRTIAARFNQSFFDLPLELPVLMGDEYVAHLYVLQSDRRDELKINLAAAGVASEIHYPVPDHLQPAVAHRFDSVSLPVTQASAARVLTLPCFPSMSEAQMVAVEAAVHRSLKAR